MAFTAQESDGFTDTNGALLAGHTPDNALGGSRTDVWLTEFGSPAWTIQGNCAVNEDASFGPTHIVVINSTDITDGRVTGVAGTNGNGIAVVARFEVATNKWYQFGGGVGGSQVLYFDGAAFNVLLAGGAGFSPGDSIALVAAGNLLKGYVNGVLTVDTSDTVGGGSNIAAGKSGMYSAGQANGFTSLLVETGTASGATPTHLTITTAPVGNQSGVAFTTQPVVAVQDGSNATVTTDTSTVTAALITVSGSGTLSGTTTKAAVSGVADFAGLGLKVTGAGSFKLRFTDGALTLADSAVFYVGAADVHITSQATTAYTQRAHGNVVVAVRDGGGVTVGNATNSITIALTVLSGAAVLTSGTTTRSASSGVATFNDLLVTCTDGATWTYAVSSSGLTGDTSSPLTGTVRSLDVTDVNT